MPASDFGRGTALDVNEIAMIRVDNEVRTAKVVIELGDGVDDGVGFQFLNHPTGFSCGERFRDKVDRSKLFVDDLKQDCANTNVGSISMQIDGEGIVQVEVLNGDTNCGLKGSEGRCCGC